MYVVLFFGLTALALLYMALLIYIFEYAKEHLRIAILFSIVWWIGCGLATYAFLDWFLSL